jgi:MFS family permease
VLVVWNVVLLGNAAVNVAEIVFAKVSLGSDNVGYGVLVGATGLGLTVGSLAASPLLERHGIRRMYAGSIALMAAGFALAALAPNVWIAAAIVVAASAGNGGALVCNVLLVQRGAPDRLRGRAFTLIMSSNYALLGLGMAIAGPLTDVVGGRWMWSIAGAIFAFAAVVALVMARRLGQEELVLELDEPQLVTEPRHAAAGH